MTTATATSKKRPATDVRRRDAIAILKEDHRDVEKLFKRFERAGDGAVQQKREIVDEIIAALSQHAAIEEQVLYPWAREYIVDADHVLEAIEEHHVVKWLLSEIETLDPDDERFDAKVTVMIEAVRHHVKEEESELFPDLRTSRPATSCSSSATRCRRRNAQRPRCRKRTVAPPGWRRPRSATPSISARVSWIASALSPVSTDPRSGDTVAPSS